MINYYELYLKYKSKYLKLKQTGGSDNSLIDIVSFNVLNPEFDYLIYLFKNNSEQIKQLYPEGITKKELNMIIKNLVKIERKEFELYRKNKLLSIIESWTKANQIVCLQEVNNNLLKTLNKIYRNQLIFTKDDDKRVIIVPNSYSINKTDKLVFDNKIKVKECLIVHLEDLNKKPFIVFNLHIHWKSNENNYIDFAKQIKNYLEKLNKSIPFIICGDFNASINTPYLKKFIETINNKFKIDTNSIAYSNDYTSNDTRDNNKLGWIDHILSHNLVSHSPTQTTNNINNMEIFYDVNQVIEQTVKLNKLTIKTKEFKPTNEDLQMFNSNKFISDHKPVYGSFSN